MIDDFTRKWICADHPRWLRNIAITLGNAPTGEAVIRALKTLRHRPSELVREHVEWAL